MKQLSLWSLLHEQANAATTETVIEEEIISTFSRKQRKYLFGPVIQFRSGGWPFPGMLLKLVRPTRYLTILDGEDDLATELEALGYLSTASLEAPLSREWAQIMFWLSDRVLHCWNLVPEEQSVWEMLGYEQPLQLAPTVQSELRQLQRWLRKTIVKHAGKSL
jgi:hypothetical protein